MAGVMGTALLCVLVLCVGFCSGQANDTTTTPPVEVNSTTAAATTTGVVNAETTMVADVTTAPPAPSQPLTLVSFSYRAGGVLQLEFSADVLVETVDPTAFSFQATADVAASSGNAYSLSPSAIVGNPVDSDVIFVLLSARDIFEIKSRFPLASSSSTTFLAVTAAGATGRSGAALTPISSENALAVADFVADQTAPELVGFEVATPPASGNPPTITLVFDEPVDPTTVDVTGITLRSSASTTTSSPSSSLTLADAVVDPTQPVSLTSVHVRLSRTEWLQILAATPSLLASQASAFVTLDSGAVTDVAGVSVASTPPFAATAFDADLVAPTLVSSVLNLDTGTLTLTYSEPVDTTAVDPAAIQLLSSASSAPFSLERSTLVASARFSVLLEFELDDNDLLVITGDPDLAASRETSLLQIATNLTRDASRNPSLAVEDPPVAVTTFVPDVTGPELVASSFDLNTGLLRLVFSENIDPVSPLPSAVVVLEHVLSADGTAKSTVGQTVNLTVGEADLNAIKFNLDGQASVAVVVALDQGAVLDFSGNPSSATSLPIATLVPDVVQPALLAFRVGLSGPAQTKLPLALQLDLSEPVGSESLRASAFVVADANPATDGDAVTLRLTGGVLTTNSSAPTSATLTLSDEDTLTLRTLFESVPSRSPFGSAASFFLAVDVGGLADTSGNPLVALEPAAQASAFAADLVRPVLASGSLDLSRDTLTLEFSEPVDPASVDPAAITVLGTETDASPVQLTSASTVVANGDDASNATTSTAPPGAGVSTVTIAVARQDMAALLTSASSPLATGASEVFVTVPANFALDVAGNPSEAAGPLRVAVLADTVPPTLQEFGLNLNTGILALTFSEVVAASSVQPTRLILQSVQSITLRRRARRAPGDAPVFYQLTGGTPVQASANSADVDVELRPSDLGLLRQLQTLGQSESSTYLAAQPGAATDLFGNALSEVPSSSALAVTPGQLVGVATDDDDEWDLTTNEAIALAAIILAVVFIMLCLFCVARRCHRSSNAAPFYAASSSKAGSGNVKPKHTGAHKTSTSSRGNDDGFELSNLEFDDIMHQSSTPERPKPQHHSTPPNQQFVDKNGVVTTDLDADQGHSPVFQRVPSRSSADMMPAVVLFNVTGESSTDLAPGELPLPVPRSPQLSREVAAQRHQLNHVPNDLGIESIPVPARSVSEMNVQGKKARALFSYERQHTDELTFAKGDEFTIVERPLGEDHWFQVVRTKSTEPVADDQMTEGLVPMNYIEFVDDEEAEESETDQVENNHHQGHGKQPRKQQGAADQGNRRSALLAVQLPPPPPGSPHKRSASKRRLRRAASSGTFNFPESLPVPQVSHSAPACHKYRVLETYKAKAPTELSVFKDEWVSFLNVAPKNEDNYMVELQTNDRGEVSKTLLAPCSGNRPGVKCDYCQMLSATSPDRQTRSQARAERIGQSRQALYTWQAEGGQFT
eukprot:m.151451 g.151451  ORF g.151451 m.151451 type:complete len:1457 (+) comp17410_c0_seq1:289-4659(+)